MRCDVVVQDDHVSPHEARARHLELAICQLLVQRVLEGQTGDGRLAQPWLIVELKINIKIEFSHVICLTLV